MKSVVSGLGMIVVLATAGCSTPEDAESHVGSTQEDLFERRPRAIFVTSATFAADLGGLAGADAKCQAIADATSSLASPAGRKFMAVLSDPSHAVADRFTTDGSFVRVDGVTVGSDFTQVFPAAVGAVFSFWWGSTLYDTILTENGEPASGPVRTGTTFQGKFEGDDCLGFTTAEPRGDAVKAGDPTKTNNPWLDSTTIDCDVPARLYCVEQ